MKYRIHRGASEIGGNCVELSAESGDRIFFDFGMPLSLPDEGEYSPLNIRKKSWKVLASKKYLPNVPDLYEGESNEILGLFISHAHQDHYGFSSFVKESIQFYLGESSKKLIDISSRFTPSKVKISNFKIIKDRVPLSCGSFKITPYLVDHSAFDAYAFLVEADGKSFFYSGDLRAHGRKHWAFPNLIRDLPRYIDLFMFETTMLGRDDAPIIKEGDLEDVLVDRMKKTTGLVLFESSAQNIDRIVTAYRATLRSDRIFVMDAYTAFVYKELEVKYLPNHTWDRVGVYFNKAYFYKVKMEGNPEELLYPFKHKRVMPQDFLSHPGKYVLCFRSSMIRDFDKNWSAHISLKSLEGASYIYSLWSGYWEKMIEMQSFLKINNIEGPYKIHCSGHAYIEDLKLLLETVSPKTAVPIHGFNTEKSLEIFKNINIKIAYDYNGDGEWFPMV